jgi:signal transduction histidine kinase
VTLEVDLPADLPAVQADPHALRRVLANLLQNALNFTPAGGRLTLRGAAHHNQVQLEVSDPGAGIAPEDLPHIFERFWRGDRSRTSGGSGLGLAIARQLVERHGGQIWAQSILGQGATIYFTLPISPESVGPKPDLREN